MLVLLILTIIRKTMRPLTEISANVTDFVKGNLGVDIHVHTNDEIGLLADGVRIAISILTVVSSVSEVSNIINRIFAASMEQAQSIAQVNQGVEQIPSVVQTNSATAEQSAAASEELSGQAQMLKRLVAQFHLGGGVPRGKVLFMMKVP